MKKGGHAGSRSGLALVITLVFVALITILVVAMSAAVLINRPAARSHFEKVRAMQFAQAGVDQVVAVLRQNIGQTNRYWISGPGQLVVASTTNNILNTNYLLYSGAANTNLSGVLQPQSLNLATFQDPSTYLISSLPDASGSIPHLQVAWVYIRQNGTQDFSTSPAITTNAIVGRYAYWADDESSKINLNLAWGRGVANASASYGYPTKVDLTALTNMTSADADAIHNFITPDNYVTLTNGFFNSPKDARRVGSAVSSVLATNQFNTTFFNHDPDMSCFSLPRIVLTTQKNKAGGRPFLDILTSDNIDPGYIYNIDINKLNTVLFGPGGSGFTPVYPGLIWYLKRTDWPMAPGSSFQQKYTVSQNAAIFEMALNIIEYTRCKESTQSVIVPLRGFVTGSGNGVFQNSGDGFIGRTRGPRITEMGLWVGATATLTAAPAPPHYNFPATAVIEVYLPPAYGLASVNLTNMAELLQCYNADTNFVPSAINNPIAATNCSPSSILNAGQYVTINYSFKLNWGTNYVSGTAPGSIRPTLVPMRVGISLGTTALTNLLDFATSINSSSNSFVQMQIDNPSVVASSVTSAEDDDPNVNLTPSDWKVRTPGSGNTFGSINSCSTLHTTQTNCQPQQDTDAFGQISDASLYMPPPKGTMFTNPVTMVPDDNTAGIVSSVGELGFIHTGIGVTGNEVPWRTLRLQPNNQPTTATVPDWALLDLFTVPSLAVTANTNADYIIMPHATSVGGRININAGASSAPFSLNRMTPLAAAFSGCATLQTNTTTESAAQAQTVAQNIYANVLSPGNSGNGFPYTGKQYGSVPYYYTPGQIAEIAGISDQGEASEQLLRQTLNQLTTRGEVFSVYTVGQSLQQTAAGNLNVTGEERLQAVVERYLDTTVTPAAIRFRIVYFQRLTP